MYLRCPEKFCRDLHFIPIHTPRRSKEVFAMAEEGGEHLLWDQLHCDPTCRQCSGKAEEPQMLVLFLSLFFFTCSEQREEKGLPS